MSKYYLVNVCDDEPAPCEIAGCKEKLNAFNVIRLWLEIEKLDFNYLYFQVCDKHLEVFKKSEDWVGK